MHLCQIHLSVVAPKLKEILLSVACLFFYKNDFKYSKSFSQFLYQCDISLANMKILIKKL